METARGPPIRPHARRTDEKYRGSYETSIMKRFAEFANSPHVGEDLERLFILIVINCALHNGDAHLKNFGIVYEDVQGETRLAPVYDLVTTSVYLPKDSMVLTLNSTTKWASAKELQRLGETRMGGTPARVREILERVTARLRTPPRNFATTSKTTGNLRTSATAWSMNGSKGLRYRLRRRERSVDEGLVATLVLTHCESHTEAHPSWCQSQNTTLKAATSPLGRD
jgi:serine/threonine-protein kinase HipA